MKINRSVLLAPLLLLAFGVMAQEAPVPKYLQLARDFVANTKPENNSYSNSRVYTRHPSDLFASEYVVATDCDGFIEDMFRRTKAGVAEQVKTQKFKTRHSIFDWHPSIEKEDAFTRIRKVQDILPGDVAAWLYLNTAGIGTVVYPGLTPAAIRPGDAVLVSGPVGDHGTAVMLARSELGLTGAVQSDCAPLHALAAAAWQAAGPGGLRVLRDATRGGVATTLNEIAAASGVGMMLDEAAIPLQPAVQGACAGGKRCSRRLGGRRWPGRCSRPWPACRHWPR